MSIFTHNSAYNNREMGCEFLCRRCVATSSSTLTCVVRLLNGDRLHQPVLVPRLHLADDKGDVRVADVRLLVHPQFGALDRLPLNVRRYREAEAHGRADGHRVLTVLDICKRKREGTHQRLVTMDGTIPGAPSGAAKTIILPLVKTERDARGVLSDVICLARQGSVRVSCVSVGVCLHNMYVYMRRIQSELSAQRYGRARSLQLQFLIWLRGYRSL